ncbi:MAG: dephospho-CoA kinase [Dehalococcoidia bacterium]|nr:dephospho-CoA kinase [Dehalococcoidia bacterium]
MKSLAITGNVGSGKSSVLNILSRKSIDTFDLDNIAKSIYKDNKEVINKIDKIFPSYVTKNNKINTKELGKLVFENPEMLISLKKIIWPELRIFIEKEISHSNKEFCVFEGAVIIDANFHKIFDYIWIIKTDINLSLERVMQNRNFSKSHYLSILENQLKTEKMVDILKKDKISYSIICNNLDLISLSKKVDLELKKIID